MSLTATILPRMGGQSEFASFFSDERRRSVLHSVFDGYYAQVPAGHIVFDTNRTWTARMALVRDLYPAARVICCVRNVARVLDSFERMIRRNPLQTPRGLNFNSGQTVYARVENLMHSETGLVGLAWSALREAWFGDHAKRLIVIDYEELVAKPERVLRALYRELDELWYMHDFQSVAHDESEYDARLGMPGLHEVRSRVERRDLELCIPPDVYAKYAEASFWTRKEMNTRGVVIL